MKLMYKTDTAPAIIARIMTAVWKKKGGSGQHLSKKIRIAPKKNLHADGPYERHIKKRECRQEIHCHA